MNVIGICGAAGSGKDTAADMLVKRGWVKVALADPMKRFCKEVFGFTDEQLWGPSERRNAGDVRFSRATAPVFLAPRYALQRLGTEWGRDCYEDVWVNYALSVAKKLLGSPWCLGGGEWDAVKYYSAEGLRYFRIHPSERERWPPPAGVVIPDCCFANEVAAVSAAGGRVVKLVGRGGLQGVAASHASEQEMASIPDSSFVAVIDNSGTIEALEMALERLVT